MVVRDTSIGTQAGLAVLSNRWYALILQNLDSDYQDFMTLREQVRGISTFKLLIALSNLTNLRLVDSTQDYQYRLTLDGQAFQNELNRLENWGNRQLHQTGEVRLPHRNS